MMIGRDYYYYRQDKITAEELFKIEQLTIKKAVNLNWDLYYVFYMLLPEIITPGIIQIKNFPIMLSKN